MNFFCFAANKASNWRKSSSELVVQRWRLSRKIVRMEIMVFSLLNYCFIRNFLIEAGVKTLNTPPATMITMPTASCQVILSPKSSTPTGGENDGQVESEATVNFCRPQARVAASWAIMAMKRRMKNAW